MVRKELLTALKMEEELELVVKGRKTGREIPRPVWFVVKGEEMLLLPVQGSSTQWYKNILKDPEVTVRVKGLTHTGRTRTLSGKKEVSEAVELFTKKYGANNIRKYYPKLNAGARLPLS